MTDSEKFKEKLPRNKKFCSWLTGKNISDKEYDHVLNVWNKSQMEIMKDYRELYLKCDVLVVPDVFEKFRNNILKIMSKSLF